MRRLIQFLWHGCWHDWRETGQVVDHYDISFGPKSFMYRAHITHCQKCGRIGGWKDRLAGGAPPRRGTR